MSNLTINKLLMAKESLTVTYVVKNSSSRDKLKAYLKATGVDPLHRIYIDASIEGNLKAGEIGYRLEAPALVKKDKNGRII